MQNQDANIAELRRESEETRAALARSVNELRSKVSDTAAEVKTLVSPAHIKSEVTNYVRESGENFIENMTALARENPLQAIAAGAAIGFPLLKLMRVFPTPLLLIGAGFWLTGKSGRARLAQANEILSDTYDAARETAVDALGSTREAVTDMAASGSDKLASVGRAMKEQLDPLIDGARRNAHDLRDAATQIGSKTADLGESVSQAGRRIVDNVSGVAQEAGDTSLQTSQYATQAVQSAAQKVSSVAGQSKTTVADFVNQNPLLTAAVGLVAGAFIAASLPSTSVENQAFGRQSSRLKKAGRAAVDQGIDRVGEVAEGVVDAVASTAAREGLDADGLQKAATGLAEKAKAVADRGLQSALNGEIKSTGNLSRNQGFGDDQ